MNLPPSALRRIMIVVTALWTVGSLLALAVFMRREALWYGRSADQLWRIYEETDHVFLISSACGAAALVWLVVVGLPVRKRIPARALLVASIGTTVLCEVLSFGIYMAWQISKDVALSHRRGLPSVEDYLGDVSWILSYRWYDEIAVPHPLAFMVLMGIICLSFSRVRMDHRLWSAAIVWLPGAVAGYGMVWGIRAVEHLMEQHIGRPAGDQTWMQTLAGALAGGMLFLGYGYLLRKMTARLDHRERQRADAMPDHEQVREAP